MPYDCRMDAPSKLYGFEDPNFKYDGLKDSICKIDDFEDSVFFSN